MTMKAAASITSSPSNDNTFPPPPSLITIPTTILANILSYTSKKQTDIIPIFTCHSSLWEQHYLRHASNENKDGVNDDDNDIDDDNLWRYLCHLSFPSSKERKSHWPSPSSSTISSWMSTYAILEEWTPKIGFYNILNANPWGMIVVLHFRHGELVGEILWYGGYDKDHKGGHEEDESERLMLHDLVCISKFALPFFGGGASRAPVASGTLLDQIPIQASRVTDTNTAIPSGALNLPQRLGGDGGVMFTFVSNLFTALAPHPTTQALCIEPLHGQEEELAEASEELQDDPWNPFYTSCSMYHMIYKLWNASKTTTTLEQHNTSLILEYVKLPSFSVYHHFLQSSSSSSSSRENVAYIKPGLYSGSYDNTLYGKFSREVVLVEYIKYDLTPNANNDAVWEEIHETIFRSTKQRDDANLFQNLRTLIERNYTSSPEIIFVLGKKVTGDIHVSAGNISWGAVVYPHVDFQEVMNHGVGGAAATTSMSSHRPNQIRDRCNAKLYDIQRKWFGFGTLAYPGFRDAGWSPGHLVYLGKTMASSSSDAFGFSWDGQEEEGEEEGTGGGDGIVESTVLTWVELQNDYLSES